MFLVLFLHVVEEDREPTARHPSASCIHICYLRHVHVCLMECCSEHF